jgi:pyridoxal phosphate enzyme (YggS family)
MQTIHERYTQVNENIRSAATLAGRNTQDIQLVVVTKTHPIARIVEAYQAGARNFGENYVETAIPKISELDLPGVKWHMIGHIQSRKTSEVAKWFQFVHSIDRYKIARRINSALEGQGRQLPVLLECNVSGEETKYGWSAWLESGWESLADEIQPILTLPNLRVQGLMTMAPYSDFPEDARPYFRKLNRLRMFLIDKFPNNDWQHLSMGMSGDYMVAIEEGATILRVGTAIMGERES